MMWEDHAVVVVVAHLTMIRASRLLNSIGDKGAQRMSDTSHAVSRGKAKAAWKWQMARNVMLAGILTN